MDNAAGNEAARTSLPVVGGHEQKAAGNPLDNVPRMDAKKSRQGLLYLEDGSQVCFDWSKLVGGEKKNKPHVLLFHCPASLLFIPFLCPLAPGLQQARPEGSLLPGPRD